MKDEFDRVSKNNLAYTYDYLPTPTPYSSNTLYNNNDDDDITVIASNCTSSNNENATASTDDETEEDSLSSMDDEYPQQRVIIAPKTIPLQTKYNAWKKLKKESKLHEIASATNNINIPKAMGIGDSGATSHFVLPGTPVKNVQITTSPLKINLPDGEQIMSTHTCELDVPWLPEAARKAHIVPGLAHSLLISIKILCDAKCTVEFDNEHCRVYFRKKLVWQGEREPCTGLWVLPMQPLQSTPTNNAF